MPEPLPSFSRSDWRVPIYGASLWFFVPFFTGAKPIWFPGFSAYLPPLYRSIKRKRKRALALAPFALFVVENILSLAVRTCVPSREKAVHREV